MSILRDAKPFPRCVAAAALFLWFPCLDTGPLAAVSQGGDAEETTVDLGFDIGEAGLEVALPIQLKAPDGVQVGTTLNDIEFPTEWLQFQAVRVGPSTDADVTASLKLGEASQDDDIVQITVTAAQGTTLTNGIVAFVVFKVADEVHEPQTVKLRNVARALSTSVPPSPIEPVAGRDGEIELLASAPVVFACFFYLH